MPRDHKIKRAFEIADDGMQGVLGYYHYVLACEHVANKNIVIDYLPHIPALNPKDRKYVLPMTHDWVRHYHPVDLVQSMRGVFSAYHSRVSVISIISIFEACLAAFVQRLVDRGKISDPGYQTYKGRLRWAFSIVLNSTYGDEPMQNRRPDLCLDIDHARRIRNLWMHNNGNFAGDCSTNVETLCPNMLIIRLLWRKMH